MDRSAVRDIVDEHFRAMCWALQMGDWTVEISYEPCKGKSGTLVTHPDYCLAEINIAPENHDSQAEVLDTLRHELLHLLSAPFVIYEAAVKSTVSKKQFAVLRTIFTHAIERSGAAAAAMLDHGLRLPVDKMLRRTRSHLSKATDTR